jgi:hypothetical protein
MSAFAARLISAAMFKQVVGTADITDYEPYYSEFVNSLDSGTVINFLAEGVPFYTIVFPGWVFAILGPDSYLIIRLFNGILGIAVVIPLNMITEEVWGNRLNRWQMVLILFWPSFLMLTVDVGRTAFGVILPLAAVALALEYFNGTKHIDLLIGLSIVSAMNAANRIHYMFYVVFFFAGMYVYKAAYQSSKLISILVYITAGTFAGTIIFVYNSLFINVLSVAVIRNRARGLARGGSVYLPELYPSSLFDLFWYLPLQGFYFLFSPMPWDTLRIGTPLAAVATMQSILLLLLVVITLADMMNKIVDDWRIFALLFVIILTAIGFGSVTKNAGAAVRWRLPSALLILTITTNTLRQNESNLAVPDSKVDNEV